MQSGRALMTLNAIRACLARNQSILLGTADVDARYLEIKEAFPDAKVTKQDHGVLVEKANG